MNLWNIKENITLSSLSRLIVVSVQLNHRDLFHLYLCSTNMGEKIREEKKPDLYELNYLKNTS